MSNDMVIVGGIAIIFILLGGLLPFVYDEFSPTQSVSGSGDDLVDGINSSYSTVTIWNVLFSVFTMFFWTFGNVVWWIDLFILTPLRLVLVLTLARNIWIGGGG